MWAILVLYLCDASIVPEFGRTLCSVDSCSVPGMQVVLVLVMSLAVGSRAFFRVTTTDVFNQLNLGLGLLLFAPYGSGLCRNKFEVSFWVAVG